MTFHNASALLSCWQQVNDAQAFAIFQLPTLRLIRSNGSTPQKVFRKFKIRHYHSPSKYVVQLPAQIVRILKRQNI